MLCPCGSEQTYAQCCQPIIMAKKPAISPEQLMRSRYCAYANKQAEYIYLTYARSSKAQQSIDDIAQWAAHTQWLKLVIHHSSDYQQDLAQHNSPQVEFSAFYQHLGQLFQMREKSNFVFEDNAWRYLDGNVSDSKVLKKPKRNDVCFCGSEKKFKHCCFNSL